MPQLLGNIWIMSGRDLTHPWDASSYLVRGDEPVLIDCGSSEGYPALRQSLRDAGYEPGDIQAVIGTHGHWDHLSGMAQLRQESGAKLYLHEADRAQVESGDEELTSAFLYGKPFPPTPVDLPLVDGQVLRFGETELIAYHTPGHTPGSMCFWTEVEGTKLLISGDTLWGAYHPRVRSDLDQWRRSLDRILELDFGVLSMGHYSHLILDAKPKVAKACETFALYFDPWFSLDGRGH